MDMAQAWARDSGLSSPTCAIHQRPQLSYEVPFCPWWGTLTKNPTFQTSAPRGELRKTMMRTVPGPVHGQVSTSTRLPSCVCSEASSDTNLLPHGSVSQKSQRSHRLQSGRRKGHAPPRGCREGPRSQASPGSRDHPRTLAGGPASLQPLRFLSSHILPPDPPPSFSKDPCNYTGPVQINQDNLPSSKAFTYPQLKCPF